jgi:hypothetical protein
MEESDSVPIDSSRQSIEHWGDTIYFPTKWVFRVFRCRSRIAGGKQDRLSSHHRTTGHRNSEAPDGSHRNFEITNPDYFPSDGPVGTVEQKGICISPRTREARRRK